MNDLWIELFIFFLVVDRPESVMNLINSENCENEFEKIIKDAECIESEEFKSKILDYLNDKKDKILELNDIYKKHSVGWSVKEDGERVVEELGCEDCISRAEALRHRHLIYDDDGVGYSVVRVDEIIDLPSVTPQPKKGHWSRKTKVDAYDIAGVNTWGIKCQCDRCTFTTIVVEDFGYYNYCPNCGAKMEVEEC